jgi:hypothetical protein
MQLICGTSCCAKNLSSPFAKNISVFVGPKSDLERRHIAPARGAYRDGHGRRAMRRTRRRQTGAWWARQNDAAADGEVVVLAPEMAHLSIFVLLRSKVARFHPIYLQVCLHCRRPK